MNTGSHHFHIIIHLFDEVCNPLSHRIACNRNVCVYMTKVCLLVCRLIVLLASFHFGCCGMCVGSSFSGFYLVVSCKHGRFCSEPRCQCKCVCELISICQIHLICFASFCNRRCISCAVFLPSFTSSPLVCVCCVSLSLDVPCRVCITIVQTNKSAKQHATFFSLHFQFVFFFHTFSQRSNL